MAVGIQAANDGGMTTTTKNTAPTASEKAMIDALVATLQKQVDDGTLTKAGMHAAIRDFLRKMRDDATTRRCMAICGDVCVGDCVHPDGPDGDRPRRYDAWDRNGNACRMTVPDDE